MKKLTIPRRKKPEVAEYAGAIVRGVMNAMLDNTFKITHTVKQEPIPFPNTIHVVWRTLDGEEYRQYYPVTRNYRTPTIVIPSARNGHAFNAQDMYLEFRDR